MNIDVTGLRSSMQIQSEFYPRRTFAENKAVKDGGFSFEDILEKKAIGQPERLKFSKHASSRLTDRNICLTDGQVERLNEGAKKAMDKGINESLVLVDDLAFIVNVRNNTVITAMDQTETNENVFTNIDGAVIM